MLRGINTISLDNKGRLAIPSRYRDALSECCDSQLVLTVDRDGCLLLYPLPVWEEIERKLIRLPALNPQVKYLQRLLIGYATECVLDNQGRILIPESLRLFAALDKSVILIGQGNKFEIWDETAWEKQKSAWLHSENTVDFDSLCPELSSLSL